MSRHEDRQDAELCTKALTQRWPITTQKREAVINRLLSIVENSDDDRAIVAAARGLIAADKLNLDEEKAAAGIGGNHVDVYVLNGERIPDDPRIIELDNQIMAIESVGPGAAVASRAGETGHQRSMEDDAAPRPPEQHIHSDHHDA